MIRLVEDSDVNAIRAIYNEYVDKTVISFELAPVSEEQMRRRVKEISQDYPYYVYQEGETVLGFCYAHKWKEREAYRQTLETTVYLAPGCQRKGIGALLMERLIEACREKGIVALIACITGGNEASVKLHERLGFKQVSSFKQVGSKFGHSLDVVDYELLL